MWLSKTKTDLIIEVWEKLDCEDVGAAEIEAIDVVVCEQFGRQAIDSPMKTARLLSDEGAVIRHSEVMGLYLARALDRPYDAAFRNIVDVTNLGAALRSIRSLDALRQKYSADGDREGLRLVKQAAIEARELAEETGRRRLVDENTRIVSAEISEWFRLWLQTPQLFETWIEMRMATTDFTARFGELRK